MEKYTDQLLLEKIEAKMHEYSEAPDGRLFIKDEEFEFEDRTAVMDMIAWIEPDSVKEVINVEINSACGMFLFDDDIYNRPVPEYLCYKIESLKI